jgi:hypothetical protein
VTPTEIAVIRTFLLLLLAAALTLAGMSCAPSDPRGHKGQGNGPGDDGAPQVVKIQGEMPSLLRDRVDLALQHVRNRNLLREHSFWTVFHGILGVGPESAMLFDNRAVKPERVKALDYICKGGELKGLQFVAIGPDQADVVTMPGSGTFQGHQDQFIAEMAQWGLPRETEFKIQGKTYTFEAFIRHSLMRASVKANQELSWAIIIIAQYYRTDIEWENQRGETLRFEDVVRYELKQPIKDSPVCGGTHRLFGLTWAYHLHMSRGGQKTEVWKDVEELTGQYRDLARKLQNKDGSFSTEYFRGPGNNQIDLTLRIHSTGHIFEWLALALSDQELRAPWMENAAHALCVMILQNRDQGLDGGALYHGTHGLEIYRNRVFGPTPHPPTIPPYPKHT